MRRLLALALPPLIAACAASFALPISPALAADAPAAQPSDSDTFTGVVWSWRRSLVAREPADPPELFTVEFIKGGEFTIRTECNQGGGSFIVDGSQIKLTSIKTTKYLCSPGWKDRAFIQGLEGAETYQVRNGELMLTTQGEVGTMRLRVLPR